MNELHLFAGIGGGILGGMLLGHQTICAVEIDQHAREVLLQRQREGKLPKFPIWDDVRTFDARPWKGKFDILCGGFPCQDISVAGKQAGIDAVRSGLWREMVRVTSETMPKFVFMENAQHLVKNGLARILREFAKLGYDVRWCVLGGSDCGYTHERKRLWLLATNSNKSNADRIKPNRGQNQSVTIGQTKENIEKRKRRELELETICAIQEKATYSQLVRSNNGISKRLDANRIANLGNAQIPEVAATAFKILKDY